MGLSQIEPLGPLGSGTSFWPIADHRSPTEVSSALIRTRDTSILSGLELSHGARRTLFTSCFLPTIQVGSLTSMKMLFLPKADDWAHFNLKHDESWHWSMCRSSVFSHQTFSDPKILLQSFILTVKEQIFEHILTPNASNAWRTARVP